MNLPPLRTLFFEDLSVGMTETLEKTVSSSDVVGFAQLTGDRNPIHLSEHFAARTSFGKRIAHGLYTASLISAIAGAGRNLYFADAQFPGAGENWRHRGSHGHRAGAHSGKVPRAPVMHLRG
jgi:acyl dehydratase